LDSHPTRQAVASPDTGDSANAEDAETTGADNPEGSSVPAHALIGGRADDPERSSVPPYSLIASAALYAYPAATLALSQNADAAEICLAGDARVIAVRRERHTGHPVAGWGRSGRCACDAPYAVARGSYADYSKTIHAGYPTGKLTADESSGDERG